MTPLLEGRGLVKRFRLRGRGGPGSGWVHAVDGVDLSVAAGECLALVGESGSGKTTLGRILVRLTEPDAGSLRLGGRDLLALRGEALRRARRRFQMIFQDPVDSLSPRRRVGQIVAEPLEAHGLGGDRAGRGRRVGELLELVGLTPELTGRFPHQLSGGQRQRVGIARALATDPELVVADEPVSALDLSVRAQVIELLVRLQEEMGLALVFIGHDLSLVEQIAHRVAVLSAGRIVEEAPVEELFARPRHPVTRALLAAVPRIPPVGGEDVAERPVSNGPVPEADARGGSAAR